MDPTLVGRLATLQFLDEGTNVLILVTSNKSWGAWGEILPDQVMTAAILDRLLHRSVTPNIQGESYRLRQHRRAGLAPSPFTETKGGDTHDEVSNPHR